MAFTYGFYNSLKGDRKYNAEQVSEIFDGILADGIIPTQGQLFAVTTANNGMQINVGTGRAWFDHTWSKNDSVMVLTVPLSDISRPRYDAVVLEVNKNDDIRANEIKIVQGEPLTNPVKPTLVNTDMVHQYPLAYIYVKGGAEVIESKDIENMVGRSPTVFATGILETAPLDQLWEQWKGEFNEWFTEIKEMLSGNVVTNLQLQMMNKVDIADKATTAEAQAGTNNTKWMTPATTRSAALSVVASQMTASNVGYITLHNSNSYKYRLFADYALTYPVTKASHDFTCIGYNGSRAFHITSTTTSYTITPYITNGGGAGAQYGAAYTRSVSITGSPFMQTDNSHIYVQYYTSTGYAVDILSYSGSNISYSRTLSTSGITSTTGAGYLFKGGVMDYNLGDGSSPNYYMRISTGVWYRVNVSSGTLTTYSMTSSINSSITGILGQVCVSGTTYLFCWSRDTSKQTDTIFVVRITSSGTATKLDLNPVLSYSYGGTRGCSFDAYDVAKKIAYIVVASSGNTTSNTSGTVYGIDVTTQTRSVSLSWSGNSGPDIFAAYNGQILYEYDSKSCSATTMPSYWGVGSTTALTGSGIQSMSAYSSNYALIFNTANVSQPFPSSTNGTCFTVSTYETTGKKIYESYPNAREGMVFVAT